MTPEELSEDEVYAAFFDTDKPMPVEHQQAEPDVYEAAIANVLELRRIARNEPALPDYTDYFPEGA